MIDLLRPHFEQRNQDLSTEERNVLCVAYKNAVGMRRIAWRAAKATSKITKYSKIYEREITAYIKKLEEEVVNMCKEMLNLINKFLIPRAKRAQSYDGEVFYLKLQGDYFRYVAEVGDGERLEKATERALNSYN
jgi:14-3-3 protein beta/theta/zeta